MCACLLTEARARPKLVDWCFIWISILCSRASICSSSKPFLKQQFIYIYSFSTCFYLNWSSIQILSQSCQSLISFKTPHCIKNPVNTHAMMSSMVWAMMRLTVSVSSSAMPWRPMVKDACLVLPSNLRQSHIYKAPLSIIRAMNWFYSLVKTTYPTEEEKSEPISGSIRAL